MIVTINIMARLVGGGKGQWGRGQAELHGALAMGEGRELRPILSNSVRSMAGFLFVLCAKCHIYIAINKGTTLTVIMKLKRIFA
jgi:hypothetical protein